MKNELRHDEERTLHNDGVVRIARLKDETRPFPRSEVLTILRTLKADTGVVAGKEALDRAIRVFEGME